MGACKSDAVKPFTFGVANIEYIPIMMEAMKRTDTIQVANLKLIGWRWKLGT